MVGPVRAVGFPAAGACHAIHDLRCPRYVVLEGRRSCSAGAGRFSLSEGVSGCPRHARWLLGFPDLQDLISPDAGQPSCPRHLVPSVERWQPWPAEPPFIDEVTRWWPSDDWPPTEPPAVIEDHHPDAPIQVIDWRDAGGLLDLRI